MERGDFVPFVARIGVALQPITKAVSQLHPAHAHQPIARLRSRWLIKRVVYAQVPPKVEYSLTERGLTLAPVLLALKAWGDVELGKTDVTMATSGL